MKFQCSDCGTNLNPGFYVCPACKHDNTHLRARADWEEMAEKDRQEARRQGFKTLRAFYESRHEKEHGTGKTGGLAGLFKSKPKPFNPDEILLMKGEFMHEGRPIDNGWMDVSLT